MTHIFGIGTVLMAALTGGASLVLRGSFRSPADMLQALAHEQVSNLLGPPTMYARLLAHIEAERVVPRFPQLRYVYTGSAPLDLGLKQRVEACSASRCTTAMACRSTRVRCSSRGSRRRARTPRPATPSRAARPAS
jgi:acyl-CoA synthetase (AMP-forming)/AMP-acid ligase II